MRTLRVQTAIFIAMLTFLAGMGLASSFRVLCGLPEAEQRQEKSEPNKQKTVESQPEATKNKTNNNRYCSYYFAATTEFLNIKISDLLLVIFTWVLAVKTGGLFTETRSLRESAEKDGATAERQTTIMGEQADILAKQHAIGRLQFLATHRPHLRIRSISLGVTFISEDPYHWTHGSQIIGALVVVNTGGTPAKIIDSSYKIYFTQTELPVYPPYSVDDKKLLIEEQKLEVGESCAVTISGVIRLSAPKSGEEDMVKINEFGRGGWNVYVFGAIRYADEAGIERYMGFARKREKDGRFYPVNYPDYEYED